MSGLNYLSNRKCSPVVRRHYSNNSGITAEIGLDLCCLDSPGCWDYLSAPRSPRTWWCHCSSRSLWCLVWLWRVRVSPRQNCPRLHCPLSGRSWKFINKNFSFPGLCWAGLARKEFYWKILFLFSWKHPGLRATKMKTIFIKRLRGTKYFPRIN